MNRRRLLVGAAATAALYGVHEPIGAALAEVFPRIAPDDELPEALRDKLMRDPLRPQFHLLPRANWMNDPCAPRYYRGQYHMFFQYNPNAAVWGDMHWNHAVSPDLIHWKHMPIALAPTADSFDSFGIFTGSVLPGMDVPTVLYTGVSRSADETIRGEGLREVQCLATSTDLDLRVWKKLDKPVLAGPPSGLKVTGFRDPCPWKEGDTWYLGVGSGFPKIGGAVLLYRSQDGHNWKYLHTLAQGTWNGGNMTNPVDTGEMWECPDFFPLGGKHVLLYSAERKVYWEVGTFGKSDLKFHLETRGLLDHGSYYAMKSMVDAEGRRILWGWVEETRSAEECRTAGWAGAMALPRVLTLGPDNELRMDVPTEFMSLLQNSKSFHRAQSSESLENALDTMPVLNRAGQIVCAFRPGDLECGLKLLNGTDGLPFCAIEYNGTKTKPSVSMGGKVLQLSPNADGISTMELWIDGSIIELFVDSKEAMTARNYQLSVANIPVKWTGAPTALKSLTVSEVTPISSDRLTS
jgi:beta-fructofuranosidase